MTNKEKLYHYVKERTKEYKIIDEEDFANLTTEKICLNLGLNRSLASNLLNVLYKENKIIKINTRPVYFLDKGIIENRAGVQFFDNMSFESFKELNSYINGGNKKGSEANTFCKLVGYDGSLKNQIEQCKAAVRYPPNGIPMLITGPTGTGKSYLAQLIYEFAKENGIINSNAPFNILNCADYANNPELLSANLFGYIKGAFTGAEKDSNGIIEESNGGYLFLDEVHRLPPEGQEKLFLFMDKGIFRRIGESKEWRKANTRLLFATTENTDTVLIDTFKRRIPIIIKLPPLNERSLNERFNLIYHFFLEEARQIGYNLIISKKVLKVLTDYDFKANIGQLKSTIKIICASAFNKICDKDLKENAINIDMETIPGYIIKDVTLSKINEKNGNQRNTFLNDLIIKYNSNQPPEHLLLANVQENVIHKSFYDSILGMIGQDEKSKVNNDIIYKASEKVDDYFDKLVLNMYSSSNDDIIINRFNAIFNCINDIFKTLQNKYDIRYYNNIGYKIACFINKSLEYSYFIDLNKYDMKFYQQLNNLKLIIPKECNIAKKIGEFLKENLDIYIGVTQMSIIMLYLAGVSRMNHSNRIKAVIIAHGFATASSIANVANKLLGENVFESFDMPLETSTNEIINKLSGYLKEVDTTEGLIILVDMGSLEEIYKGINNLTKGVIGIINNITTQIAISTGNGIIKGLAVEQIVDDVVKHNKTKYKLLKPEGRKKNILITTCLTGIGTAIRIKDLILKSLGDWKDSVQITAYDYTRLKNNGYDDNIFKDFNVIAIIGTKCPEINEIPFLSLDDIILGKEEKRFTKILHILAPDADLSYIKQSIIKNFSLESVLNYITIINPNKIVDQIEMAMESLQYGMGIKFTDDVKVCLYVHLSCLIERLVTKNLIDRYDKEDLSNFEKNHKQFIELVKKSFSTIEKLYSVSLPQAEIYFIYEILSEKMPEIIQPNNKVPIQNQPDSS